ncbi:hypothetical protein NEOLEDRAFT_1132953 [Neolentinus lepideus HHB14362 ss-1]|uniref:ER transporter 6TM N-terminal domain-containing protein n=1 Tax=Neolentinus lepideus HHB14362 ss-1 TaxID=1314782 RepID=A0A165SZR7_9AGAM|nr:hypothetical protein NEOLEDRAFT_1132953 [Neolentinus lepideus HHB14362 ss-1]
MNLRNFRVPSWITQNARSTKSLKLLFRCWLAAWLAFVLLLPNKSLQTLGNAAFFGMIVSLMLPPNMPVQTFLFAIAMLYIGLLLGWAFGAAAMRASLAARSQVLLKQTLQKVQQSAAGRSNPDALYQIEIFEGWFLDPRSSAVYGAFLGACTFLFALMRAYVPKLAFTSIFATISIDIFCSYAPLFPFAEYTLLNSILISSATYTAIACICIILVFPETVAHAYLYEVRTYLEGCRGLVRAQEDVLDAGAKPKSDDDERVGENGEEDAALKKGTAQEDGRLGEKQDRPPSSEAFAEVKAKIDGMRVGLVGSSKLLDSKILFADLEFSYGKWNSDDLKGLQEPLKTLGIRIVGLQTLTRLLWRIRTRELPRLPNEDTNTEPVTTATSTTGSTELLPLPLPQDHAEVADGTHSRASSISPDTALLRALYTANLRLESTHALRPEDILPLLREVTGPLRESIIVGLECVGSVVEEVNTRRWARFLGKGADSEDRERRLVEAVEQLRSEFEKFKGGRYKTLVEPFAPLFDDAKGAGVVTINQEFLPLRSLYLAYVFSATLLGTADATLSLMDNVASLVGKRRRRRLWAPKGIRALGKVFRERQGADGEQTLGEDVDAQDRKVDGDMEKWEREAGRDPDSRQPENAFQKVMNGLSGVYGWAKTAEVIFAVKYVVLTIGLWLPAVFHNSAKFNYEQKGVWALIMAQMTLNVYASDQIFNYFTRLIGTFIGLIIGLLVWYIGSGHGKGNPYGIAASFGVFMIPTMFIRLFAPPALLSGVVTSAVTIPLIVGYSWIDGHLPVLGNPGVGWSIAWKRWVLVVIGSAASFIIMMLPPKSGRKAVRLRNATTIKRIGNLYSLLISRWIENTPSLDDATSESWSAFFRADIVSIAEQLQTLKGMTAIAKWEGGIRGRWPFEEYDRLVDVQIQMLGNLGQLGGALAHINKEWRQTLLHRTRLLNPNFIADVLSLFALISQSLRTAEPLPEVLPQTLFERLAYHHHRSTKVREALTEVPQLEQFQSLDYMIYANGMTAVLELIVGLDELHAITRRLCGGVSLKGFEEWRNEYLSRLA